MLLGSSCTKRRILAPLRRVLYEGKIAYAYLKQKDLDEIKSKYPDKSFMDHVKIGLLVVKALCV